MVPNFSIFYLPQLVTRNREECDVVSRLEVATCKITSLNIVPTFLTRAFLVTHKAFVNIKASSYRENLSFYFTRSKYFRWENFLDNILHRTTRIEKIP